jgi:hypothetical protein
MNQIQKELSQLEHWLIHLPEEGGAAPPQASGAAPPLSSGPSDWGRLLHSVEQLTKQMELQQATLHHIIGRVAVLESVKEVHIESDQGDPWMDNETTPFVPDEEAEEHAREDSVVYIVHKSSSPVPSRPHTPEPEQAAEEAEQPQAEEAEEAEQPQAEEAEEAEQPQVEQPQVEEQPQVKEPVEEKVEEQPEVVEEQEAEEEPKVEVVEQAAEEEPKVEVVEQAAEEQPKVEVEEPKAVVEEAEEEEAEEAEEESEEEGVELEEITYQGKVFYRDPEQFVYTVNDEGEVSEEPVGYWKEKTKTIAFYNKK